VYVRVKVSVNAKYYAIKVVPESFRIRVFFVKWSHIRGTYPWSFVTQICHSGQPSHGCDRKNFEVMTNVDPLNRFAHKERIWYDFLCPHKKE
jgi:hypothetical protein